MFQQWGNSKTPACSMWKDIIKSSCCDCCKWASCGLQVGASSTQQGAPTRSDSHPFCTWKPPLVSTQRVALCLHVRLVVLHVCTALQVQSSASAKASKTRKQDEAENMVHTGLSLTKCLDKISSTSEDWAWGSNIHSVKCICDKKPTIIMCISVANCLLILSVLPICAPANGLGLLGRTCRVSYSLHLEVLSPHNS